MNHQGNVSSPQFTGHGKRAGVDAGQLAQDAAWMAARTQASLRQLSGVEAKTVAEAEVLRGPVCLQASAASHALQRIAPSMKASRSLRLMVAGGSMVRKASPLAIARRCWRVTSASPNARCPPPLRIHLGDCA